MTNSSNSSTGGDPLDLLTNRLATEWAGFTARERSAQAGKYREAQAELLAQVKAIGQSGDIDLILAGERTILENEFREYGNSAGMRRSVKTGLVELAGAEEHLEIVRNPEHYRTLDVAFQRPRHRREGLPDDEARQFFRAHNARLLNQDRSRLTDEEKRTLEARRSNLRVAERTAPLAARLRPKPRTPRPSDGPGASMGVWSLMAVMRPGCTCTASLPGGDSLPPRGGTFASNAHFKTPPRVFEYYIKIVMLDIIILNCPLDCAQILDGKTSQPSTPDR